MTKKIQQLITELEKEIAAFDGETRKRIEKLENSYEERKEELETFLIAKGMNPIWRVAAVFGSWYLNIRLTTADGDTLARMSINREGIVETKLEAFGTLPLNITTETYERICGDFTTAVNFFNYFDYEALDKKVRELELDVTNKLQDKLKITHKLEKYLEYFKDCIARERE